MSWFRKSFAISIPDPGSFYCALDPIEFYEWRYTFAPKGAKLTTQLPPSDIFTEGKVIASVQIDETKIKPQKGAFVLTEDTPVSASIKVGYMPSPAELLDKHKELKKTFARGVDSFKENLQTRIYIDSQTDRPHLFRLYKFDNATATLHNFGPIDELVEKFSKVREVLSKEILDKTGRAFEMEKFKRYDSALLFANNSHLHVDASKMDRLVETAQLKSKQTITVPWKECYIDLSHGAKILNKQIEKYESMKWVQDALRRNV